MPNYKTSDEVTILQYLGGETTRARLSQNKVSNLIRCAIPAKIVSVDYSEVTCSCQPLIREKIKDENGEIISVDLPVLLDVPIVFPGSSSYCITFPLSAGDEGLVIFADMCIDAWWQSGDVQDQFEVRRHDLSDGFFIPSQMSQPMKYTSIDQNHLEIKSRASEGYVLVDGVNVKQLKADFDDLKQRFENLKLAYDSHVHFHNGSYTGGPENPGE